MRHPEYSLPGTLERIYENQRALEAAIMELFIRANRQGGAHANENIRGALQTSARMPDTSNRDWPG